jgi:hypothetical protein
MAPQNSWTGKSAAPRSDALLGRWRQTRQNDLDRRSLAQLALKLEPAAQVIGDDAVDDVQTKAGTAPVATSREEWVKRLTLDLQTHATAIVGKNDLDTIFPPRPCPDVDDTCLAVGKRMRDRVEEQVCKHLSVGSRIAAHRQISLAINVEGQMLLSQTGSQAPGDLLG